MIIGSHVSISGGLIGAAKEAHSYGANTFMVYTGAPQNSVRKPLDKLKIDEGRSFMDENGIKSFVVHAPYIINLASYKDDTFNAAVEILENEIYRTIAFGSNILILHPGSFTDKDAHYGIDRIASGLNKVLKDDMDITICLETMAGKGSEIGRSFEELKAITDKVNLNNKIGICFDTCHVHDSGYDIVNDLDGVIADFDRIIGLDRLKVFHLNGSLNPRGARKDRHANIGAEDDNPKGKDHIGFECIYKIAHHPASKNKPLILETPWLDNKTNLYKQEIALIKNGKEG
ncbi:MAG: deoxyribonuclease IV [Lachnospiraceae bacterium]|nr:deoxyribonuclease IV [Lachnospiraceae bacterium]